MLPRWYPRSRRVLTRTSPTFSAHLNEQIPLLLLHPRHTLKNSRILFQKLPYSILPCHLIIQICHFFSCHTTRYALLFFFGLFLLISYSLHPGFVGHRTSLLTAEWFFLTPDELHREQFQIMG